MKDILDNPTSDNLLKALTALELPVQCTIKPKWGGNIRKVDLPRSQFFTLKANYPKDIRNKITLMIIALVRSHKILGLIIKSMRYLKIFWLDVKTVISLQR